MTHIARFIIYEIKDENENIYNSKEFTLNKLTESQKIIM